MNFLHTKKLDFDLFHCKLVSSIQTVCITTLNCIMRHPFILRSCIPPYVFLFTLHTLTSILCCSFRGVAQGTIPPIVFTSRALVKNTSDASPVKNILPGIGGKHRFTLAAPGKLMLRKNADSIITLIDGAKPTRESLNIIDVSDPCVSWDAGKIVFAGVQHRDSSWRIFEIDVDGKHLHQITRTDRKISGEELRISFGEKGAKLFSRYDDTDPCYVPDGRICFSSTRYPQIAAFTDVRATNLYIVNTDGTGLHRITAERNGADEPTIDPFGGRIVYARWWRNPFFPSDKTSSGLTRNIKDAIDIPEHFFRTNFWQALTINADGTDILLYSANRNDRAGSQVYKPYIMKNYDMLAVYHEETSLSKTSGGPHIRVFIKLSSTPRDIFPHDTSQIKSTAQVSRASSPPFATNPVELPDGRILFSYAKDLKQDFGIYVCNPDGSGLMKVLDIPERTELDVEVLLPKKIPPIEKNVAKTFPNDLPPTDEPWTFAKNGTFTFHSLNVHFNGPVDFRAVNTPPVGKPKSIRFFINPQRKKLDGSDEPILIREEKIEEDGSILVANLPAEVPMFEELVDEKGKVVRWDEGVAHVAGFNFGKANEVAECGGCHTGHTAIPLMDEPEFVNIATAAQTNASSFVREGKLECIPAHARDRVARTIEINHAWIANGNQSEWISFSWDEAMKIRKLIFYNPRQSDQSTVQVREAEVVLFLGQKETGRKSIRQEISPDGTRLSLGKLITADSVVINIKGDGFFAGKPRVGLAEVEIDGMRSIDAAEKMYKKE